MEESGGGKVEREEETGGGEVTGESGGHSLPYPKPATNDHPAISPATPPPNLKAAGPASPPSLRTTRHHKMEL